MNEPTMRSPRLRAAFAAFALLYAALSLAVLATASAPRRGAEPAVTPTLEASPLAR